MARIRPGLLALGPVTILIAVLGLKKYSAVAVAGGVLVGAGAAYLVALLVRYYGKTLEDALWSSWGGRDTTRFLRLREAGNNPVERDHWRAAVEAVTGVQLLDATAEAADPQLADQTIEAAIGQVLHLGRGDKRYPLVFAENIHYGFERNVWGIRWFARAIALACTATLALVLWLGPVSIGGTRVLTGAVVAGLVIDGLFFLGWFLFPSKKRTRFASGLYARRLMEAVVAESHASDSPPSDWRKPRRRRP